MATIIIPTPLRKFTNQQTRITVEGKTIKEAFSDLILNYPDVKKNLIDENEKIRGFVNIFLEDEDIRNLQEEETIIQPNSVISIIPAIAGGSGLEEINFTKEELARYNRHIIIPEFGIEAQKKLKAAKVLVIGSGGLGSPLLLYLAAAGVGTLGIVDLDVVDDSNLQRQVLFGVQDIGTPKVESAKIRLKQLNPHIKIKTYNTQFTSKNALEIIKDYDVVADGTDNFPAKFLINDACVLEKKPFSHAGIIRFKGQLMTYVPGEGPCYRCVFKNPPPKDAVPTCKQAGVIGAMGGVIGSLQAMERETQKLYEKGPNRVNPLLVPLMICNMAAGNVSIQFGLKGKSINDVTACATGTNTIGEAYRSIQYGEADVMVAGGTEGSVCPIGIAGFTALTALSTVDDPTKCSLPFDKNRSGFVMGEGAGVVILEELEHAKARGAKIYAEVVGYGCSSDAYHITSPQEDGAGAARAMTNAMSDAGVTPADVKYINAHGTGTHHNDLFETRAIKLAFGDEAANLKINSTKSMIGHLLGAAGAVEFITCVKEIQDGFIHKTVGYETPDEEIDLNYCKDSYEEPVEYALSNSLGFGGHNASILLKAYK